MKKRRGRGEETQAQIQERKEVTMRNRRSWEAMRGTRAFVLVLFLLAVVMVFLPAQANARAGAQVSVGISVSFGPPPLPVYVQPMCPGPGYIWTPGYWSWDTDDGYYWVPGTWVLAPFPGALWTPGYWGWSPVRAVFLWHPGYWGLSVGFYGGINYGFGYFGHGYDGGYWRHGHFFYNRSVNRVNVVNITHVYYRSVTHRVNVRRISYNGGRGGIVARPTRRDFTAERERRMGPIGVQERQRRMAGRLPGAHWSRNHGRPEIAATPRPGKFMDRGVVRATRSGGTYRPDGHRGRPENGAWHSFEARPVGRRPQARPSYKGQPARPSETRQNQHRQQIREPQRQPRYQSQPKQGSQTRPRGGRQQIRQRQAQPQPEYRGRQNHSHQGKPADKNQQQGTQPQKERRGTRGEAR